MNGRCRKEAITAANWPSKKNVILYWLNVSTILLYFLINILQILVRFRKALDLSESIWTTEKKEQPFVAPISIPMMRITIASTIEMVEFLLNDRKWSYVLTGKFNQDCLEVF